MTTYLFQNPADRTSRRGWTISDAPAHDGEDVANGGADSGLADRFDAIRKLEARSSHVDQGDVVAESDVGVVVARVDLKLSRPSI